VEALMPISITAAAIVAALAVIWLATFAAPQCRAGPCTPFHIGRWRS
jgi:hypothetical protein